MFNTKSITPCNNKGQAHGYWEFYLYNKLWYKCFFHNGREVGYREVHHTNFLIEDVSVDVSIKIKIFHII
jgi:hypothetical protein